MQFLKIHIAVILIACAISAQAQITRYSYHDDEKQNLKEMYQVKDTISNILEGKYISYYLNGNIESQGQFSNNETVGSWNFYYETGKLKMTGTLEPNSNDGYWEYYYESGNKSMEGEISDNKRTGDWRIYFESGELKEEGAFKESKREGPWRYYYESGSLKGQVNYTNARGQFTEFYSTGEVRAEGTRVGLKNVGKWQYFYKDGNLQAEGVYENGLKTGEWTYYHRNGNVSASGAFLDGEANGDWVYFYPNGKESSKGAFVEGEKSGYWGVFFEDGSLKGETIFKDGTGIYKEYYTDGSLKIRGSIVEGKRDGLWKYYYLGGDLEGECEFNEGTGEYLGYYPDGTLQTKGTLEEGKKVGRWELYDKSGSLTGYYKPIYDEEGLQEEEIEAVRPKREYGVADYKFTGRKIKYFESKINEFQGVIMSINPLGSFIGRVPFAVEFYMQERLGHEFEFEGIRDPFYTNDNDVPLNDTYTRGYAIALKQKFYNEHSKFGLLYFGHEMRFTNLSHFANIESTRVQGNEIKVSASEQKVEYSVLLGYRLMQNTADKGFTIDAYVSLGTGYRNFSVSQEFKRAFDGLDQSKITFKPSFGVNFGYILSFGKRGRK
ncbi:membrane-binding protein [Fulvivirga sp. RKSG066]|uniref:toxin-antitoxin system YwqK family antitoxin n=1 Tax=Fulvivirga aurantia TaxID=2529383 RepID=UPI0012BC3B66|nr:toxin-antitoxin system YwqK family antitoxin [Fulvivirga aurantia]MTI22049.1 membrane-binding protein [Fulvivirga aurantia]